MRTITITTEPTEGELSTAEQAIVTAGFTQHTSDQAAPPFERMRLVWRAHDREGMLVGVATADLLWDWIYVDELWVDERCRGTGLGRDLLARVERYAEGRNLSGVWLWTQSWQAEAFYRRCGYTEFTRFEDFPKGHARIGFRKNTQGSL
jgi:GNAT superfamily N-acetyltransferase